MAKTGSRSNGGASKKSRVKKAAVYATADEAKEQLIDIYNESLNALRRTDASEFATLDQDLCEATGVRLCEALQLARLKQIRFSGNELLASLLGGMQAVVALRGDGKVLDDA